MTSSPRSIAEPVFRTFVFALVMTSCMIVARPDSSNRGGVREVVETTPPTTAPASAPTSCPQDLSVAPGKRTIDNRAGLKGSGAFSKDDLRPAAARDFLSKQAAIARVIGIERKNLGLVPAGFRTEFHAHEMDASFRLRMATCELAKGDTTRRAAYDASIAYLLGAAETDAAPMISKGLYPTSTSSSAGRMAGDELAIEDALARTFASMVDVRDDASVHGIVGQLAFGLSIHCGGNALCNFRRGVGGGLRLEDRREHPSMVKDIPLSEDAKTCILHTSDADLEQCQHSCWAHGRDREMECRERCAAWCKPER
jgi:hypothetical protein